MSNRVTGLRHQWIASFAASRSGYSFAASVFTATKPSYVDPSGSQTDCIACWNCRVIKKIHRKNLLERQFGRRVLFGGPQRTAARRSFCLSDFENNQSPHLGGDCIRSRDEFR